MAKFNVGDVETLQRLARRTKKLMADIDSKSEVKKQGNLTIQQTFPRLSKTIIDDIDRELAKHYEFTDEELDFIINYDIKYRMGLS